MVRRLLMEMDEVIGGGGSWGMIGFYKVSYRVFYFGEGIEYELG